MIMNLEEEFLTKLRERLDQLKHNEYYLIQELTPYYGTDVILKLWKK